MASDPYKYFRVEARELTEQLGQCVLDLEKGEPAGPLLARMLRLAHTLKGAARVVRQPEIADSAHELEDVFGALKAAAGRAPEEQIGRALGLLDQISARLSTLALRTTPEPSGGPAAEEAVHAIRPDADELHALAADVAGVRNQLARMRQRLEQGSRVRHLIELLNDHISPLGTRDGVSARASLKQARAIAEELRRGFALLERDTGHGVDQMDRELRQVGDAAARLALVPARAIFGFLERAARDAAQSLGKRVTFAGGGGDIRVDASLLTDARAALLQLVRNAVAHGIEPDDASRLALGKPPDGRVTVAVSHRGTWLTFSCADDGRGIDVEALRRTLRRRGVALADEESFDVEGLLRTLVEGGISTSEIVSGVAGRGVGLDVVREAAERLGGRVTVRTVAGRGTTFELIVPFSTAAIQGLIVEASGLVAAVPLDTVPGTLLIDEAVMLHTPAGRSILHEGRNIPVASLGRVMGRQDTTSQPGRRRPAFIVEGEDGAVAVMVDRIRGADTVVTRRLPELAPAVPAVAGVALDAGGQPYLVLDPAALVAAARRREPMSRLREVPPPPAILVIDDSLTTRMLEQSILESAGYAVELAASAEEGLVKARSRSYALFLVDVEMPGMDGFTFIEQVRADPALQRIPAILVTSRAADEDRRRGEQVGARGYIAKGEFDQNALLERIDALLRGDGDDRDEGLRPPAPRRAMAGGGLDQ